MYKGYPLSWFTGITHYNVQLTDFNKNVDITIYYSQWWKLSKSFKFGVVLGKTDEHDNKFISPNEEGTRLIAAISDYIKENNK